MDNKWHEKRIKELLLKPYDQLSYSERLELVCDRYEKKQDIFYEEYVMMALANHEVYFAYNNTEYKIDHGMPNKTTLFITEYDEKNKKASERIEHYSSVIELLNKVKINGRLIREIWENTNF